MVAEQARSRRRAPTRPGPARTPRRAPVQRARRSRPRKLSVALTGPTGDIGRSVLRSLERSREVGRIVAMARRRFDPRAAGLTRTEYRRGDVLDAVAVRELVAGADVVVHLAFTTMGGLEDTERVNVDGSRTVFEAAVAAGALRLVYASSAVASDPGADRPPLPSEDGPPLPSEDPSAPGGERRMRRGERPGRGGERHRHGAEGHRHGAEGHRRGAERHRYSAQRAHLERVLAGVLEGSATDAYVMRPCIVAGPDAPGLVESLPYVQLSRVIRRTATTWAAALALALERVPAIKPVLPDPGVAFQLVHHDDVGNAFRAAVLGRGAPGTYDLAGPGEVTMSDLASALGWYSVPVPAAALDAIAELVARLPLVPRQVQWIESLRAPMPIDAAKARRELGWRPRHDALATLAATVEAARARGSLGRR